MSEPRSATRALGAFELLANLSSAAAAHGIAVERKGGKTLSGRREAIRAKWLLGGIKSIYRFSCRLDEASVTATFREMLVDR